MEKIGDNSPNLLPQREINGILYNERAGIFYRRLPDKESEEISIKRGGKKKLRGMGEVIVGGTAEIITPVLYTTLEYLGHEEHYDKLISSRKIAEDLGTDPVNLTKTVNLLRKVIDSDLPIGTHRIIGSPRQGFKFTNPTVFSAKQDQLTEVTKGEVHSQTGFFYTDRSDGRGEVTVNGQTIIMEARYYRLLKYLCKEENFNVDISFVQIFKDLNIDSFGCSSYINYLKSIVNAGLPQGKYRLTGTTKIGYKLGAEREDKAEKARNLNRRRKKE